MVFTLVRTSQLSSCTFSHSVARGWHGWLQCLWQWQSGGCWHVESTERKMEQAGWWPGERIVTAHQSQETSLQVYTAPLTITLVINVPKTQNRYFFYTPNLVVYLDTANFSHCDIHYIVSCASLASAVFKSCLLILTIFLYTVWHMPLWCRGLRCW